MFQQFDEFVLLKVEKCCHWFQRMTGKTNFYLNGLVSFIVAAILVKVYFSVSLNFAEVKEGGLLIWAQEHPIIYWMYISYYLGDAFLWHIWERLAYDRLGKGLANPYKKVWRTMRLVSIFLVFGTLPFFPEFLSPYDEAYIILSVAYLYLSSCDPLPPCSGKIKDWLSQRKQKFVIVETVHS
jgi:hypothetical protein